MNIFQVLCLASAALTLTTARNTGELDIGKIEWRQVDNRVAFATHLVPSGIEWGHALLFVCRAFHNGRLLPGKLAVNQGGNKCYISDHGLEHIYLDYEILSTPPGTTSWIEGSGNFLPNGAIVGGYHYNGTAAYICRAWVNKSGLVVGTYSRLNDVCYLPLAGKELESTSYQILARNPE